MMKEFVNLSLPKADLIDLYRALMMRHVVENTTRHEQGLEEVESPSLERMEAILGLEDGEAHRLFHEMEDALWQYAWYAYTDEWAWYRAQQEVRKQLGSKATHTKRDAFDHLVEACYDERFDEFSAEIDMKKEKDVSGKREAQRSRKKGE